MASQFETTYLDVIEVIQDAMIFPNAEETNQPPVELQDFDQAFVELLEKIRTFVASPASANAKRLGASQYVMELAEENEERKLTRQAQQTTVAFQAQTN